MWPPHLPYGIRVALDFLLRCRVVRPNSALYKISVRRPENLPARTPRPDIRLPSDSTSRWTPLPSANASCYRARSGLSPPSYRPCRAHAKKETLESIMPQGFPFSLNIIWRREWDSNPRYPQRYAGFQDRCLKPTRPSLHDLATLVIIAIIDLSVNEKMRGCVKKNTASQTSFT